MERVSHRGERSARGERPWWGNPVVWLAVSAALVLIGVFVVPRFLPGIVILVPFLWIRGPRRRASWRAERRQEEESAQGS